MNTPRAATTASPAARPPLRLGPRRFGKYEGLGNDFLVVDGSFPVDPESARRLCDRHLGPGGDGVLVVRARRREAGPRLLMDVWNADGSRSEMCGAAPVDAPFQIETGAGPHTCLVDGVGASAEVTVEMAVPSLAPADVPYLGDGPLVDAPLPGGPPGVAFTAVSMGNPHLVTFDPGAFDARRELGPSLEHHPSFPNAVNVGFGRLDDGDGMTLHVWERGVGWTRACGTGACAAAVAAVETGRAPRGEPLMVVLPGGALRVTVGARGTGVRMAGPARHVYDGALPG